MKTKHKVIAVSVMLGLLVWVVDAVLDYLIFYEGTLLGLLITDVPNHELYIRLVMIACFLIFGIVVSRLITERKKAEEALHKSEKQASAAIEAARALTFSYDIATGKITWGGAIKEITGYTPKEFAKVDIEDWAERIHPEDRDKVLSILQEAIETLDRAMAEYRFRKKDGSYVTLASISITEKEYGKAVRLVGILQDITERKKAEEELRESERRYRQLFEGINDSVMVLNSQGRFVDCNEVTLQRLGYSSEEFFSLRPADLVHPDFHQLMKDNQERIWAGEPTIVESLHSCKDGKLIPVEVNALRIEYQGEPAILAVVRDITERKRAEEAVKEAERRYKAIFDNRLQMVYIHNEQGLFLDANDYALERLGYTRDDLGKVSMQDMLNPEDIPKVFKGMADAWAKGVMEHPVELRLITKSGETIWVETFGIPLERGVDHYIGLGMARDITERKQAEEALRLERDNFINILEAMEDGVYIVNQQYDIQYVNPVLKKDFGPFERHKCYEYFHDRKDVCPWCKNQDVFAGKTVRWEWYSFKNQKTYDLIDTPLKNPDGSISKLEIFRDITERKRADEELICLSNAVKMSTDSIVISDLEGKIIDVNEATLKMYGTDEKADLIGKSSFDLIAPEDREKAIAAMEEVIEKGYVKDREYHVLIKDGSKVPVEMSVSMMKGKEGELIGFMGVTRDITGRKLAEEDLKMSFAQIRDLSAHIQYVREEERKYIAREIHDELGQVLTALKMNLSLMSRDIKEKKESIDLQVLLGEIDAMQEIIGVTVKRIRELITELRPEVLDNLGLLEALEWQANEIQDRTGILCELTTKLKEIKLDKDRSIAIFRIYQEALVNVTRHAKATKVIINISKTDGKLLLEISDNGIGIPQEKLKSRDSFGMIGMKERAYVFGGDVEITGRKGKGTTVRVSIPMGGEQVEK
ncbi:PAS domain S-box protein [candidate division KSB1 bacterium]|nr:PAS domain S-box protein [candidate division KSB1 bacterium]